MNPNVNNVYDNGLNFYNLLFPGKQRKKYVTNVQINIIIFPLDTFVYFIAWYVGSIMDYHSLCDPDIYILWYKVIIDT